MSDMYNFDNNNYNNENHDGFNHYEFDENNSNTPNHKKPNAKMVKFAKKVGAIALSAVLFGGVAAGSYQGVNALFGTSTQTEAQATTSTKSSLLKTTSSTTSKGTMDVTDIVKSAMPSIVSITSKSVQEVENYFGMFGGRNSIQQQEVESAGSGIIIGKNDSELLIATNNHVIDGAETVSVSFVDNETYEATIKGTDSDKDLAVVAVPLSSISSDTMSKISVATIGDSSKLEVGEQVVAIGNALGYGQSVTTGIVSAVNRALSNNSSDTQDSNSSSDDSSSATYIQTDAAINPGNSGGALLNMNGEVIGINSAKLASTEVEGMGYAISMNDAYDTIEELMNETTRTKVSDDEKASLGISGTGVSDEAAEAYGIPSGVFVSQVTEGGAAEQAGITANSIITAFDGKSVSDISELKSRLEYYKAGEEVEVTLQVPDGNGYTEKTVKVTLGKADSSTDGSSQKSGNDAGQDQNQGQDPYNYDDSDDNSGNYFRFSNSQKSF